MLFLSLDPSLPASFCVAWAAWKCLWSLLRNSLPCSLLSSFTQTVNPAVSPAPLCSQHTEHWQLHHQQMVLHIFLLLSQHWVYDLDPSASKVLHWVSFNIALYYSWCIVDSTASIYFSNDKRHKLHEKFINFKCFVGNCYPEKFSNCLLLWVMEKLLPEAWLMSFKTGYNAWILYDWEAY